MRVLVSDDDAIALRLLERLLLKWGYEVECTSDGFGATAVLDDPMRRPDIAILDWVMPEIDGPTICKRIKNSEKDSFVYIILLTGKGRESDVVDGLDSGADDYMVKPIKAEELKSRVAVGARMVEYERRLKDINRRLKDQNDAIEKYARIMETLAEERAKQLVHAERLSAIGELSAGIAHEINNYLTPVMGYAEMLSGKLKSLTSGQPPSNSKPMRYLDEILSGSQRIRRLVERMRSHSRKGEPESSPADLNEIILHALELCTSRLRRCSVQKSLYDPMPKILCVPQELEQVFLNIFRNAADAMDGTPHQTIEISTGLGDDDSVIAEIADSGTGIPQEHIEHIWESFFTTKPQDKGTGLGLSVSKRIIESHDGRIEAFNKSGPETGATFRITLPIRPKTDTPSP